MSAYIINMVNNYGGFYLVYISWISCSVEYTTLAILLGLAKITVSQSGTSNPSPIKSTFVKMVTSPVLNFAMISFRKSLGVSPSICSALIPTSLNSSANICSATLTNNNKLLVYHRKVFCNVLSHLPICFLLANNSLTSSALYSPALMCSFEVSTISGA